MLRLIFVVASVQVALAGQVGYPYHLNPAHVTYLSGPAPPGLAAGPAAYAAPVPYATPTAYAAPAHFAAPSYAPAVAAPSGYGSFYHGRSAFVPRAYSYSPYQGYAAVPHAVSAVPTVHHVPGVADVPVTKIEHQPAFIQKVVDVAKPAVQTRKIQVRRPAIQKQFYDIEERVVVRPAGSALVELDEPTSKVQKGPTVVSALAPAVIAHPGYPVAGIPVAHPVAPVAAYPTYPAFVGAPSQPEVAPAADPTPAAPQPPQQEPAFAPQQEPAFAPQQEPANFAPQQEPANFAPQQDTSNFASPQQPASFAPQQDLESVAIENPEFSGRSASPTPAQPEQQQQQQAPAQPQEPTPEARAQIEAQERAQFEAEQQRARVQFESEQRAQAQQRAQLEAQQNNAQRQQYEQQQREQAAQRSAPAPTQEQPAAPTPAAETRQAPEQPSFRAQEQFDARAFLGRQEQQLATEARFRSNPSENREVVPSLRSLNPEVNKANQERLIQLLTARGGVAEVQGYPAGSSRTGGPVGDAGVIRARVLSATPAPDHAEPAGERVSTRRIVVSRPIETLQEYDVVEPATKIHRVTVQQPTLIKTARLGVARVPTSVPVYGKTLTAHPIAYY